MSELGVIPAKVIDLKERNRNYQKKWRELNPEKIKESTAYRTKRISEYKKIIEGFRLLIKAYDEL